MAQDTAVSTASAVTDTVVDSKVGSGVPKVEDAKSDEIKTETAGGDEVEETVPGGKASLSMVIVTMRTSTYADKASYLEPKPNGRAADHDHTSSRTKPKATDDDLKMKDIVDSGEGAAVQSSTIVAATNGTPASTKKTSNGSSKKKSSAIPEHKTKKLNKKKSKPQLRLNAEPGQLYLARLKGHQPWPSIICDEAMLPDVLLSTRPITTAQPDGTFKKPDYADGGKRENERTFPIMFL